MPIFIELVTDAFEESFNAQSKGFASQKTRSGRAGSSVARRPTRGLEIKEETHASIKVILTDGSELQLADSSRSDGISTGYSNFILQSVNEARMEKHQIVETFGAPYIFFFGENPRFLDVTATLINSHDFNWEAEWWENYNENFRGTKLVEKGGRLYMFYDDNIVEGYMIMSNAVKSSVEPHRIDMSFRLFLTNYRNISFIGSPQFPIHDSAILTEGVDVANRLGPARDQALVDASPDRGSALTRAVSNGGFATAPRLSELLRDANRQGSVDPTTQAQLDRLGVNATSQRSMPFRGLISQNTDEYVGLAPNSITMGANPASSGGLPQLPPGAQQHLETEDLHQETVNQLGVHGADVNNPTSFTDLGIMPNFESDARSPASFKPKEKQAFGFDTNGETTGDDPTNPTTSFRQDPLGAIFGGSMSFDRAGDNRFTEGTGDAEYGFRSEFSSGPGFGQTGDGSFGGPGFGSGQGAAGDPGFKDPSRFTFAGVVQNKGAFNKFRKPRPDQSSFGKGAGIASSSSGLSGGASVRVGGKPSPFSLISVPGTLKL